LLLRGEELTAAKAWAARRKENAPEITPLLSAFLAASEDRAAALQNEERRRLAERERLVAETELAQSDIRRVQRRSYVLLTGLLLLVVLGTVAGLWAVFAGWRELMVKRAQFLAGMIRTECRLRRICRRYADWARCAAGRNEHKPPSVLALEASAQRALDSAWRMAIGPE
jgi:hypothetical protein